MTTATSINVTVNGEPRRVTAGATIAAMLRELGIDPARVAVERNLAIVPRSTLDEVPVTEAEASRLLSRQPATPG